MTKDSPQEEVEELTPPIEPNGFDLTQKRTDQAKALAGAKLTWALILASLPPYK